MYMKPVSSFATIVLGAVLIVFPAILGGNGLLSFDQALAQKGGNGGLNGNAGGLGGSANGNSAASNANGQIASKLGALNAAHASAQAFAHASLQLSHWQDQDLLSGKPNCNCNSGYS